MALLIMYLRIVHCAVNVQCMMMLRTFCAFSFCMYIAETFFFFLLVSLITICLEPFRKLKLTNHINLKISENPFFDCVIYIHVYMYMNFLHLLNVT